MAATDSRSELLSGEAIELESLSIWLHPRWLPLLMTSPNFWLSWASFGNIILPMNLFSCQYTYFLWLISGITVHTEHFFLYFLVLWCCSPLFHNQFSQSPRKCFLIRLSCLFTSIPFTGDTMLNQIISVISYKIKLLIWLTKHSRPPAFIGGSSFVSQSPRLHKVPVFVSSWEGYMVSHWLCLLSPIIPFSVSA